MRDRSTSDRTRSGNAPFCITRGSASPEKIDFDRPSNPPPHDPLTDAFGETEFGQNKQLADVRDEKGGMHFFRRVYATKPCFTLVDVYKILPNPIEFEDYSTDEAVAKMREIAKEKAAKITAQLEAHNVAHPAERYGLIVLIGDDIAEKTDVAKASQGEIVGPCGDEPASNPQANPQGRGELPPK